MFYGIHLAKWDSFIPKTMKRISVAEKGTTMDGWQDDGSDTEDTSEEFDPYYIDPYSCSSFQ